MPSAHQPPHLALSPTASSFTPGSPAEGLIVVVDDTEANRYTVARWLIRAGFRVAEAASGEEALALAGGDADLVLLDVNLPDVSGFEVTRRLKAAEQTAHLPVLHLSAAKVTPADRAQGLQSGADGYLTHPIEPEELVASVRTLLRLSRTERELRHRNAALENALTDAERAATRMARLQAVTAGLARATTAADVAAVVLDEGRAAVGAAAAAVFTVTEDGTGIRLLEERGFGADALAPSVTMPLEARLPFSDPARTGEPVWMPTLAARLTRYPYLEGADVTTRFASWVALPLWVRDRRIGSIKFAFAAPDAYGEEERALMSAFAAQCAQALERAWLYDAEREARAEAERARHEAERASRTKSDFLAVMSHELRTPLNAIGGHVQLMEMGLHGTVTEVQREALGRVQAAQRHLLGLVNDVLNFVRIEGGRVEYRLADVAPAEVLDDLEGLVAPQFRAKGVRYERVRCDTSPYVRADRDKLQQILVNLLTNALKFTDAGGRVRVECEEGDAHVTFRVHDTGIGIANAELGSIFEPFVQVNQRLTRPNEGVGLGLAISRDLARGMDGELLAESTPGVGSAFTLVLPRAAAPNEVSP